MEIKDLNYKKELFNFNYKFDSKKIYGILGDSSTLFELIKGIKKPTSGTIIDGKKSYILYENDLNFVNKSIFLDEELKKICKKLNIDDKFLNKDFSKLSMGEKNKINYILMKSYNPDVIMIENFFENLDSETKKIILNDLRKMEFDESKIIIISSKDIDFIFEVADEIIVLFEQIILSGNKFDVFENIDLLKSLEFDMPKYIEFVDYIKLKKNVKLPYRDRIGDIAKDVYDNV